MWINVDARLHTPIYQQIVDGVKEQIALGRLRPGDRMLTVRELANKLSLNHNTVAKAYQELERERVIELVRGRGTFVAVQTIVPDLEGRKRALREALKKWFVDAHHLQLSEAELLAMFHALSSEIQMGKGGTDA